VKLEEVLRENQRLLKAKLPEQIDRGNQTETWTMERYLDELETLKRRKWITDKENKENKERIDLQKEKLKKLKEDCRRFLKKINDQKEKENKIDSMIAERDLQIKDLKSSLDSKTREMDARLAAAQKEAKYYKDGVDDALKAKVAREVELMKREEEIQKKIEAY
jgi:hypothetical protein